MKIFQNKIGKSYATIKSSKGGFTLIELVVVIAIMAVLALIMVPNLTAYVERARRATAEDAALKIHRAAQMVRDVDGVHLGKNGNLSPQGIKHEVSFDSEDSRGRYDEKYVNLIKNYISISDKQAKGIKIRGSDGGDTDTIRVYYKLSNNKYRIYITDSEGKYEVRYQKRKGNSGSDYSTIETTVHRAKK